MTIYDELKARGLIAQVTDEEEIKEVINNGKATFYIGFDCTDRRRHHHDRRPFWPYRHAQNADQRGH